MDSTAFFDFFPGAMVAAASLERMDGGEGMFGEAIFSSPLPLGFEISNKETS